jgi:uncharacterized repeat protein (TIGR02543 family)
VDSSAYEQGATVTVLGNTGNLTKTGKAFAGWNTAADGSGTTYTPPTTFTMGSANVILYAKWSDAYTVTYNANGADPNNSVPTDTTSYGTGIIVTVLGNTGTPPLVKAGSAFAGWNTEANGSGTTYTEGNTFAMGSANVTLHAIWVTPINTAPFDVGGVSFKMVQVPSKTFPTSNPLCNNYAAIPCNDADTEDTTTYWISETEVTYELWSTVRTWATANGYNFQNAGAGSGQQPVTTINWRDAMVWSNAATEWYNANNLPTDTDYTPVYRDGSNNVIKDSRDANAAVCDAAVASGNGFRLLTSEEWELAARYKVDANGDGDISDPGEYYPGNYASGATAPYTNATATGLVAWYSGNSSSTVHDVKTKTANALGLYDMSGNVWEWCFDLNGTNRMYRGGSWASGAEYVELGYIVDSNPPTTAENKTGLRLGRTP